MSAMKEVTEYDDKGDHTQLENAPTTLSKGQDVPLDYDDPHAAALADADNHEKVSWTVLLAVFFLGISLTGPIVFGFSLVAPSTAQLVTALGSPDLSTWIVGSWSLAAAASFTIAGTVSDVFGRRPVVLLGSLLTIVGAVIQATSHTMPVYIAGQVILGLAIGACSVGYAGIAEIVPNRYRGAALAFTEFNLAIWSIVASLLSHYILENSTFHIWTYICLGYGAVCLIGIGLCYFPPSHPRKDGLNKWQHFKQLDFIGATLFIGGLTLVLFGLNSGGALFVWASAGVIVPLVLGAVCIVAAFWYDAKFATIPVLPWRLFKDFRGYSVLVCQMVLVGLVFVPTSILVSLQVLYLYSSDAVTIGLLTMPNAAAGLTGGILPIFLHKWRKITWQFVIANVIQLVACALLTTTTGSVAWLAVCSFFVGATFGFALIMAYTVASLNVPQKDLGIAVGLIGSFRSIGNSLGSTIFLQVFNQVSAKQVTNRVTSAALGAGLPASSLGALFEGVPLAAVHVPTVVAFAKVEGITEDISAAVVKALLEAYKFSFKVTYAAIIPVAVVGVITAFYVRDASKYLTGHVAVHLEKEAVGRRS